MPESNIPISKPPDPTAVNGNCSIEIAVNHSIAPDQGQIIEVARQILADHDFCNGEVSIAIVDDQLIRNLNREYLNHDYETDVLSFVLEQNPQSGTLQGEVIVSADTAIREATTRGLSANDELLLYIIHGMLHLVGMQDGTASQRAEMRNAERRYTSRFGIDYASPEESTAATAAGGQAPTETH